MLQLFEKSAIIKLVLLAGTAVAFGIWLLMQPMTAMDWLRLISATISVTTVLFGIIAFSSIWRIFWWVIRPLNWWVFPDLNGEWQVTMNSNIGKLAEIHPELKDVQPKTEITGTITIKQNLLGMVMVFHGSDNYSNSETTFVKIVRTKESGRFKLAYVYENETPSAERTDEQRHFGAGQAEARWIDNQLQIEGVYWTNRKWREGLNTAGTVIMTRQK